MKVQLVTPNSVLAWSDIVKINAEGAHGNFCVLPKHSDYLAPLVPGILVLTTEPTSQRYFAVDHGMLVKRANQVRVTVLRAIRSANLQQLRDAVSLQFRKMDSIERAGVAAVASLEASFVRRLLEMQQEFSS